MNFISFRVLFVCIFLPPILYIFSVQLLEHYLQADREKRLKNVIIQDYEGLYSGRHGIKEEINANLDRYAREDRLRALGVSTEVVISTKKGELLYPLHYDVRDMDFDKDGQFESDTLESFDYIKTAEKNFQILNAGLILSVDVKVKHNSWLTNSILIFYLFSSIALLYGYYRKRANEWAVQNENEQKRIAALSSRLAESELSLEELSAKEQNYVSRIDNLDQDKKSLKSDIAHLKDAVETQKKKSLEVDEVLEEMERLETQAQENIGLKEEKEQEIIQLREEINRLEMRERQGTKKKKKDIESIRKRFSVIYKNLSFYEKAFEGYALLTPDFQLKAEELIHKLNEDDSLVTVKRKVFSKKGKLNTFEVVFSYSGRIYFKKRDNTKLEIVTIGTKNTQEQDLKFVESVS